MLPAVRRGRPAYPDVLTPREWEVLALIREGLTNEQIAQRLGISESGARYHVSEILSKLGVESRQEAAMWGGQLRGAAVVIAFVTRKIRPTGAMLPKAGAVIVGTAAIGLLALALGVAVMERRAGQSETRQPDQERLTADGTRGYDTPAQAAQAAGFDLPSVSAPGWATMSPVIVQKSQRQPSGGLVSVLMAFQSRNSGGQIELLITSPGGPPEASMPEPVTLANGREVRLGRQGNQVGVKWNEGGRSFTGSTFTSDTFSEADFLLVLASLK
jgi:DNA-binding CsgD family transcriptional regulator